jgi:hypothetical protein
MGLLMKIKRDELAEIVENSVRAGVIERIRAALMARGLPARSSDAERYSPMILWLFSKGSNSPLAKETRCWSSCRGRPGFSLDRAKTGSIWKASVRSLFLYADF